MTLSDTPGEGLDPKKGQQPPKRIWVVNDPDATRPWVSLRGEIWAGDPLCWGEYVLAPSVASDTAPTVDGKAVEALTRARDAFLIYAKSAEGHHATKYELAGDLRIQAGLIDAALAALASAKRFKTGE